MRRSASGGYATHDKNLRLINRVNGELIGTRITSAAPAQSELRIDFSIVDDDEPEAVYEIQVLSGRQAGKAQESEAIEVQGDTPAGRIEDAVLPDLRVATAKLVNQRTAVAAVLCMPYML